MQVISLQKARGVVAISTAYRVHPWNEQPRPTTVVALVYEMLGVYSIFLGDEGPQGGNQALSALDVRIRPHQGISRCACVCAMATATPNPSERNGDPALQVAMPKIFLQDRCQSWAWRQITMKLL